LLKKKGSKVRLFANSEKLVAGSSLRVIGHGEVCASRIVLWKQQGKKRLNWV